MRITLKVGNLDILFLKQECNRTFVTAYHLSQHFKRTHTDVRPFVCQLCGRTFAAVTDLNLHLRRTHLQLKPYRCDQCTKTFKSSTHLRSHRDTHTGQFRYSCSICNRICHSGPQLTVHMREYHPGEEEPQKANLITPKS